MPRNLITEVAGLKVGNAGDAKIKTNRLEVVNAQAQEQLAAAQR